MLQKEERPKEKREQRETLSERLTEIQRIDDPELRCNKAHALLEEITAMGEANPAEKGRMHEKDVIPVMEKLLAIIETAKEHLQDPELLSWLEGDLKMFRARFNAIVTAEKEGEEKEDEVYRGSATKPLIAEGDIYERKKRRAG